MVGVLSNLPILIFFIFLRHYTWWLFRSEEELQRGQEEGGGPLAWAECSRQSYPQRERIRAYILKKGDKIVETAVNLEYVENYLHLIACEEVNVAKLIA